MARVRFAPSPTGALHVGGALTAVANRAFADQQGGTLILRIDDTDAARSDPALAAALIDDLEWLGVGWEEGPIFQSGRHDRYAEASGCLVEGGHAFLEVDTVRFEGAHRPTLVRADGRATYHLASVVDDIALEITHVIRGRDHAPNAELQTALARALGAEPPQYLHHGLVVGPDGKKLSKRDGASSVAELRAEGVPAEALAAYLTELGMPRHDVAFDRARLERLSTDAIAALSDHELAERAGTDVSVVPVLRGARDLAEARRLAEQVVETPEPVALDATERLTIERASELVKQLPGALNQQTSRQLLREVKAVGGNLRTIRVVLTGAPRGPELWAVIVALGHEEVLARLGRALDTAGG